jgi:lipopolysaccharide/colanic/teichoic acid biosynthesis glycosyltransferase
MSQDTIWPASPWERRAKRAVDVGLSLLGLGVASPLLAAVSTAVVLVHGWPPIFRQERAGYRGRPFTLYKLKTMTDARDASGRLLPDAERLTRLGEFLRSTSLDELPELLNVLKGDMSLVGPRPLLLRYLERYDAEQIRRHDAPVGLTGWAQVSGRNAVSWEKKFELDLWYVRNWSLALDAEILLRTLRAVLTRQGISAAGEATMGEFLGSASPQHGAASADRQGERT